MRLNLLLRGLSPCLIKGTRDIDIGSISYNSKQVKGRGMFFAVEGADLNGYDYIDEAIQRGAVCIVAEEDFITYKSITKVIVRDIRISCAKIAANFYNHPSDRMNVTGITGTNGKTTTLYMVSALLRQAGMSCGMIGTVSYEIGPRSIPAVNTTPSSVTLQMLLSDMEASGIKNCAMEVSSHALDQGRVEEIKFNRVIFTNLTGEHLDYHGNMDAYFQAKRKLFSMLKEGGCSIINIDDSYGSLLAGETKGRMLTYGIKGPADIKACEISRTAEGTSFKVCARGETFYIDGPIIGEHNIYNMLSAIAFAVSVGLSLSCIKAAMKDFKPAPGRMERINYREGGISVFIDYAHTDNALFNVLTALAEIKQKRIITVFGCGGDRDKQKRPRMARVAAGLSDFVVITSDNPRGEEPGAIIDDIKKGLPEGFEDYKIIVDREKAIRHALTRARRGDIVLIAGKGHESYQVMKDVTIAFDDKKVAFEAMKSLGLSENAV
ncbi:MAG: UDP-N-acetylmuramoyl-L-alanyl-D-glutamate--2,6-diaminopimelate ligase [Candidatus Omnitrophota bacterium]|jgi:UDP-N-acetylmuramoyl-L-alanyl-D-glutamate--2,6-diaminopimelate ligase